MNDRLSGSPAVPLDTSGANLQNAPMGAAPPLFRIGYCTSGLQGLRLDDALRLLSDLGYRGVFITLDVHHLDPFADGTAAEVARIRTLLDRLDLVPVVETGARYLLDPRRKHWPTLLSTDGAARREEFLATAISIARDLGAPCISCWAGANDELAEDDAWSRLVDAIDRLVVHADDAAVDIGFEPEPGMLIETVPQFHRLREAVGNPDRLKLSLDCGHLLVTGEAAPEDAVRTELPHLACVAIEDMKRGVHDHLPFGEGDLDLPPLIAALSETGFAGVVAVELGRHSHVGPELAARSKDTLAALGVPFGVA